MRLLSKYHKIVVNFSLFAMAVSVVCISSGKAVAQDCTGAGSAVTESINSTSAGDASTSATSEQSGSSCFQKYPSNADETVKTCIEADKLCAESEIGNALKNVASASAIQSNIDSTARGAKDAMASGNASGHANTAALNNDTIQKCVAAINACNLRASRFSNSDIPQAPQEVDSLWDPSSPPTASINKSCKGLINPIAEKVNAMYTQCINNMSTREQLNKIGALESLKTMDESNSLKDFLTSDTAKGAALGGAGALGMMCMMGSCPFGGDDDDDDDGPQDTIGDVASYTVQEKDGGQCLFKDGAQAMCYSNDQLLTMCGPGGIGASANAANSQAYAGGAAQYNTMLQQQQATEQLRQKVCTAYAQDTRPGGGADPEMCHKTNENYFKEQDVCKSEMIAMCANTEGGNSSLVSGDCGRFNHYYCFEENAPGADSNYCVYKEAKSACGGEEIPSTAPACMWLTALQRKVQSGGLSCYSNFEQNGCYPDDFPDKNGYADRCDDLGDNQAKDPVCNRLDNNKFHFVFRNPGTGNGSDVASGGGNNSSGGNQNIVDESNIDCQLPDNFLNIPACQAEYCSFVANQRTSTCQKLLNGNNSNSNQTVTSGVGTSSVSYIPLRYPAGQPAQDVSTNRSESIFTSTADVANSLCESGQLMDCGPLEGYIPNLNN